MQLKIDSREPQEMIDAMKKAAKDSDVIQNVTVEQLETADFVAGDIGIERKESSDFAASVQDRRISEQGDRMVEEFSHRYVILEGGGLYDLKYTNIGANSLIGQQVSLAVKRSINLINTNDVDGTAFAVRRIVERVDADESVGHVKTTNVETDDVAVKMLCQIRGISPEKAEKILDEVYFDDLVTCANDYEGGGCRILKDELEYIDGIGPKLAERVINAFN